MSILGGTIKISEVVREVTDRSEEAVETLISAYLVENRVSEGKLVFALSSVNVDKSSLPDQDSVKDRLKKEGVSVRYLEARGGLGAAPMHSSQNRELMFLEHDSVLHILRTLAIQDIDDWSARDFGKPYRDPKKGMLPPKLARMMVNLSIGDRKPADTALLDPFCGTGTVLMEASMVGVTKVYGADLDRDAVIAG
jgi:tRNA G10  N-methylase Trm11